MEYVTRKPRSLTATEARLLRTIEVEGNWLADPKCLTHDDLEALEFLRYLGMIEKASFGGYKLRGQGAIPAPATPPDTIRAILDAHGLTIRGKVLPCRDARAWSSACYCFMLARGQRIGAVAGCFGKVVVDGDVFVVELKGVG